MRFGIGASQVRKTSLLTTARVFVSHQTTPFMASFAWTNAGGWGTKSANPAALIGGNGTGAHINPATSASLAVGSAGTPYINAYAITSAGFGTKYGNPATLPPTSTTPARAVYSVQFNEAGTVVAAVSSGSPYVNAYPWTDAAGFGTKFANPSVAAQAVSAAGQTIAWSGNGGVLIYGSGSTTLGLQGYLFNASTGFGTKLTDVNLGAAAAGLQTTKSRDHVLVAKAVAPWIDMYPFTTAGFGTKFTNPVTASTQNATAIAVSHMDDAVIMTAGTAARSYQISASGFGTAYAAAAVNAAGTASQAFGTDDLSSFQGSSTSPFFFAYPFSSTTGFGTRYTAAAGTVPSIAQGIIARS